MTNVTIESYKRIADRWIPKLVSEGRSQPATFVEQLDIIDENSKVNKVGYDRDNHAKRLKQTILK